LFNGACRECADGNATTGKNLIVVSMFLVLAMVLCWKYRQKIQRNKQKMKSGDAGKKAESATGKGKSKSKSFSLSVIVNGLQTITIFIGFDLDWPDWLKTTSGAAGGVVFMNPVQLFSPECEMKIGYSTKVILYILTPWVILGLFAAARNRVIATARAVYVDAHFSELSKKAVAQLSAKQVRSITKDKNAKFNKVLEKTKQQLKVLKLSSIHNQHDSNGDVDDNIEFCVEHDDEEHGIMHPNEDESAQKEQEEEEEEDSAQDKDMVVIALSAMSLQNFGMALLMNLYTFMVVVTTEPYSCLTDNLGIQYVAADPTIRCWEVSAQVS
jgi:hypothetical protein